MLRLQCSEIMHALRHKNIMINTPPLGLPEISEASNKTRQKLMNQLIPVIERSHKFIFDSGSDQDELTTTAVKETAINMIEAGLFHQPFPDIWIEDPYEESPETYRNFYLAREKDRKITLWSFTKLDMSLLGVNGSRLKIDGKKITPLCMHMFPLVIDLDSSDGGFMVPSVDDVQPQYAKILGETVYAYKKFIVSLNTENLTIEKVLANNNKKTWNGDPRTRQYDHSIVRVPMETAETTSEASHSGDGKPRRKHLVRGFVWGKNTRPLDEQRWIKPYWRGTLQGDIVERTHYVIGKK